MNYTTYYNRGQKVFLINTSADRDDSVFDAFSATITSCSNQSFELRPRYTLHHGSEGHLQPGMQYKVTAESYGAGVQFSATVTAASGGELILKPSGSIEMYQRTQVPRMDLILGLRVFTRSAPLAIYRSEWQRFVQGLTPETAAKLDLTPSQINLGVGGLRYMVDRNDQQTDLAMVFIELEPGAAPVCAVAEQLWRRSLPDEDGIAIGRRFVLIRKDDQRRIQSYIQQRHKKQGKKQKPDKSNWELLDRMFHER